MQLKKITKYQFIAISIFTLLFFGTRLPSLGPDVINPDGVNWHERSQMFVVALKKGEFASTYQHYHPGVTLMWVTGIPIELVKKLSPQNQFYNHENFMLFHIVAKLTLVLVQYVLTLGVLYLLYKALAISKYKKPFFASVVITSLFTFEPFFLGNSRLYHLDILLTLFIFIALILFYLFLKLKNWRYLILSSLFVSLSFLTKSIAVGLFVYLIVILCGFLFTNKVKKFWLKAVGVFLFFTFLSLFFIFPALWVAPLETLLNIFDEADRVGIRKGHDQIFLGDYSKDPGVLFYIFVFIVKATPVMLFGLVSYILFKLITFISLVKKFRFSNLKISEFINRMSFETFLTIFYLGYFIVMVYPSKKIDRYMLPMFPLLGIYTYLMLVKFQVFVKNKQKFKVIIFLLVWLYVYPILKIYPYYFTYTSPLVLNSKTANLLIAQKPFGVGIPGLKEFIFEKYGDYPDIGFIDTKPMRSIYMNSRLFDIRISGTSDYDLIVLGPNEEMPDNVIDSPNSFVLDSIYRINGLDYWRIYVKESLN